MATHVPFQYTEAGLETAFRATVGDPASNPAQRWSAAEVMVYLNRGAGQLVLDIPGSLKTQWEISTVASTREYLLPVDFIADTRVEYVVTANTDERVLIFMDEEEWKLARFPEDKSATGDPQFYTYSRKLGNETVTVEQPMHIILEPAPDAIKTLRVHGFKLMQNLVAAGTDVPELAMPMMEAVISWGAAIAMRDDGDLTRARDFRTEYEAQVRKILNYQTELSMSKTSRLKPWNVDTNISPVLPWERRVV